MILSMVAIVDEIVAVGLAVVVFRTRVTKMGTMIAAARSKIEKLPQRIKNNIFVLCVGSLREESIAFLG